VIEQSHLLADPKISRSNATCARDFSSNSDYSALLIGLTLIGGCQSASYLLTDAIFWEIEQLVEPQGNQHWLDRLFGRQLAGLGS